LVAGPARATRGTGESQETVPCPPARGRALDLGARTLVMGILNVTPDSFADDVALTDPALAADAALRMEADGADIIDIGGESTRPGAEPVPEAEELRRVVPVIERVARHSRVPLSIDTYKAEVARAAIDAGAMVVNDISGLRYDPALGPWWRPRARPSSWCTRAGGPARCTGGRLRDAPRRRHRGARGEPRPGTSGRHRCRPDDRRPRIRLCEAGGPQLPLLARLWELAELDRPLLTGVSRKSFLGTRSAECRRGTATGGTAAAVTPPC